MKTLPEIDALVNQLEKRRSYLNKLLNGLRSALAKDDWDLVGLERGLRSSADFSLLDPDAQLAAKKAIEAVRGAIATEKLELESRLRELCSRREWRIDGQWPRFFIERAIEVYIDEEGSRISVADAKLKGLTKSEIETALAQYVKSLLPRRFDPLKFVGLLADAYDQVSPSGGEAPMLKVYQQMIVASQSTQFWRDGRSDKFQELNINQFRARLSTILESGMTSAPDGRELRLHPPIDPKDALFVYQPAERRFGFVGRLSFQPLGGEVK